MHQLALMEQIGKGAYSKVFKALSVKEEKVYALKQINLRHMNKRD